MTVTAAQIVAEHRRLGSIAAVAATHSLAYLQVRRVLVDAGVNLQRPPGKRRSVTCPLCATSRHVDPNRPVKQLECRTCRTHQPLVGEPVIEWVPSGRWGVLVGIVLKDAA